MRDADLGQAHDLIFFGDFVILGVKRLHYLRHTDVVLRIFMRSTRNDQWSSRFIDQDVVNFIDDGKVMGALNALIPAHGDIVAQVVKTKLAVGSIGNISQVGLLAGHRSEQIGSLG